MFTDDADSLKKQPELLLRKLDALSVKALEDYIAELQVEIERVRAEVQKRGGARAAAESFFS